MAKYKVSATLRGKRITTSKYWLKKKGAKDYARETNDMHRGARARVIKV